MHAAAPPLWPAHFPDLCALCPPPPPPLLCGQSPYRGALGTLAAGSLWSGIFGSVYVPVRAAVDATAPADQRGWGPVLAAAAGSLAASSVRVPLQVKTRGVPACCTAGRACTCGPAVSVCTGLQDSPETFTALVTRTAIFVS
jgi:hypothetical protein